MVGETKKVKFEYFITSGLESAYRFLDPNFTNPALRQCERALNEYGFLRLKRGDHLVLYEIFADCLFMTLDYLTQRHEELVREGAIEPEDKGILGFLELLGRETIMTADSRYRARLTQHE